MFFQVGSDSDKDLELPSHPARHRGRVPRSPSPVIDVDDHSLSTVDADDHGHGRSTQKPPSEAPTQSPSPQVGSKRVHTDDSENDSENDSEADNVHVSKVPKIQKKTARPKAGDYDDLGKEMVLAAANIYRALLASQAPFPNTALELKLIKKSWRLVNAESGMKEQLALTPSIVTIVSEFI